MIHFLTHTTVASEETPLYLILETVGDSTDGTTGVIIDGIIGDSMTMATIHGAITTGIMGGTIMVTMLAGATTGVTTTVGVMAGEAIMGAGILQA